MPSSGFVGLFELDGISPQPCASVSSVTKTRLTRWLELALNIGVSLGRTNWLSDQTAMRKKEGEPANSGLTLQRTF